MTIVNAKENSKMPGNVYDTRMKKDTRLGRTYYIEKELIEKMKEMVGSGLKSTFVNDAIKHYFSYLQQQDVEHEEAEENQIKFSDNDLWNDEFATVDFENIDIENYSKRESLNDVEGEEPSINLPLPLRTKMIQRARHKKESGV